MVQSRGNQGNHKNITHPSFLPLSISFYVLLVSTALYSVSYQGVNYLIYDYFSKNPPTAFSEDQVYFTDIIHIILILIANIILYPVLYYFTGQPLEKSILKRQDRRFSLKFSLCQLISFGMIGATIGSLLIPIIFQLLFIKNYMILFDLTHINYIAKQLNLIARVPIGPSILVLFRVAQMGRRPTKKLPQASSLFPLTNYLLLLCLLAFQSLNWLRYDLLFRIISEIILILFRLDLEIRSSPLLDFGYFFLLDILCYSILFYLTDQILKRTKQRNPYKNYSLTRILPPLWIIGTLGAIFGFLINHIIRILLLNIQYQTILFLLIRLIMRALLALLIPTLIILFCTSYRLLFSSQIYMENSTHLQKD